MKKHIQNFYRRVEYLKDPNDVLDVLLQSLLYRFYKTYTFDKYIKGIYEIVNTNSTY